MSEDDFYVEWCRTMFRMLAPGGVWGIPRSGLMFRKDGGALVLIERTQRGDGPPLTESALAEQQDSDFEAVSRYFGLAGVTVRDET